MTRRRVTLIVELDVDPVAGIGSNAASWRKAVQAMLDRAAGHYRPTVATIDDLAADARDAAWSGHVGPMGTVFTDVPPLPGVCMVPAVKP
jgi:hypothetical protein